MLSQSADTNIAMEAENMIDSHMPTFCIRMISASFAFSRRLKMNSHSARFRPNHKLFLKLPAASLKGMEMVR